MVPGRGGRSCFPLFDGRRDAGAQAAEDPAMFHKPEALSKPFGSKASARPRAPDRSTLRLRRVLRVTGYVLLAVCFVGAVVVAVVARP
jgi:hypothetical protein